MDANGENAPSHLGLFCGQRARYARYPCGLALWHAARIFSKLGASVTAGAKQTDQQ
jgi:hypothetical protein